MECTNCGTKIVEKNVAYCPNCKKPIKKLTELNAGNNQDAKAPFLVRFMCILLPYFGFLLIKRNKEDGNVKFAQSLKVPTWIGTFLYILFILQNAIIIILNIMEAKK